MIEARSFPLSDQANQLHTLEVGAHTLTLDGAPATIVALHEDHVLVGTEAACIAVSYTALGQAVLGEHPTLTDAGQLLAHSLARWSALHQLSATLTSMQAAMGQTLAQVQPWLEVPVPPTRFDAVTRRALDAFDGTAATTAMLAHILGQAPDTIVAWAHQQGKTASASPAECPNEQRALLELAASCTPITPEPVAVSSAGGKKFRWSTEMAQQLEADFFASQAATLAACTREIADRYGWPAGAVQSKVYELGLPRRKRAAMATQREAESPASESHPSHEERDDDQA